MTGYVQNVLTKADVAQVDAKRPSQRTGKGSGTSIKASLQKTKIGEAVVKLRAPVWCRPKALRCLSQLRREVKVGGWCRFPMWDFVKVAAVSRVSAGAWHLGRVSSFGRREGVSALGVA
ncbi:unnamed protein product [Prunus armeniaca]